MKKTLNLLVMSILIFFMNIMIVKASKVIYDSKNANGICNSVKKETIKIGVHSYYNKNDTILKQTENTCNNTKYFTDNLSNKVKGQDYPSWTLFNMSNSSFKHSIEGVDVTDNNKYRYFYISNRYQLYKDKKLLQSNTLKSGDKIFIDIDIKSSNVKKDDYNDLRCVIDYGFEKDDVSLTAQNSITYYIYDVNNKKYGPYKLDNYELIKRIYYSKDKTEYYLNQYRIVSDNLISKVPKGVSVSKIRIYPYENYPVQNRYPNGPSYAGLFKMYSLSITAYQDKYKSDKKYITLKDSSKSATVVRQNVTNNMATVATIKWGVSTDRNLLYYCSLCTGEPRQYNNGKVYYGLAYVNQVDGTISSFLSHTGKNKNSGLVEYKFATKYLNTEKTSKGETFSKGKTTLSPLRVYEPSGRDTSNDKRKTEVSTHNYIPNKLSSYFVGVDCSSSTFSAIGKELPYVDSLAGSSRYLSNPQVRLLGNMNIDYAKIEENLRKNGTISKNTNIGTSTLRNAYTSYIKKTYSKEQIYNGYGLLRPGDALITDGHVRMVTGYSYVECVDKRFKTNNYQTDFCKKNGSTIDGSKSYVIISETRGRHINMAENDFEVKTHINQKDARWTMTPDKTFTDVTNIDDLYTKGNKKEVNFRLNKKYMFNSLYLSDIKLSNDSKIELDPDNQMYLPYRYKSLDRVTSEKTIEKPKVNFVFEKKNSSDNLYNYLKKDYKLRGTIITNYMIEKIKIQINNSKYYIAPNQTNFYSLYYNLNDTKILNALKNLNYDNDNTIKISVYMGPNISDVKKTLNLDSEGFMTVVTIKKPSEAVVTKLSDILKKNGYNVSNGYVYNFKVGDTITDIKKKIGNDITITANTSTISTGTILKKDNESYTAVIKGDLSGDGKINSSDLLFMKSYLIGKKQLTGAYKQAGKISSTDDIKSLDLLRLRQYLLGKYKIS